mmetsp:Transcript_37029/g.99845  ORF Transcript_37029/g.99845 Transcript_37029/m.99845 type:complete len:132 (-) Transcript_37029:369-764(-)
MYSDEREKMSALVSIGKLQTDIGRLDLAVLSYREVLDMQPGVETPEIADAHMQVAISLLDSQQYHEAVTHLETATAIVPTLAAAHLLLANSFRDMVRGKCRRRTPLPSSSLMTWHAPLRANPRKPLRGTRR